MKLQITVICLTIRYNSLGKYYKLYNTGMKSFSENMDNSIVNTFYTYFYMASYYYYKNIL